MDNLNCNQLWDKFSSTYDAERANDSIYSTCVKLTAKNVNLAEEDIFLELGCGTGMISEKLRRKYPHNRMLFCDFSLDSLQIARNKLNNGNTWFICGDISHLPFKRDMVNVVLCANTLQSLRDDLRIGALREIRRVARHKSKIVITVHQYSIPKIKKGWKKVAYSFKNKPLYCYRYEEEELAGLLGKFFDKIEIRGIGHPAPDIFRRLHLLRIYGALFDDTVSNMKSQNNKAHMLLAHGEVQKAAA